jgi:TalC/MipB family fructose-6-phosphate aldolase
MLNLYVDSAEREVAEPLLRQGLFAGVTTNPTLLERAGLRWADLPGLVDWALAAGARTVFLQSWGQTSSELVERGTALHALSPEVVVKVPATGPGVQAACSLVEAEVPVLVTAVYARYQAVAALAAGADFIAPYLGRMDDAGLDGLDEIRAMQQAVAATGSTTRILAASVRTPLQVLQLAEAGVSDVTLSPAAWDAFFANELTAAAVAAFDEAAESLQGANSRSRPHHTPGEE